MDQNKNKSSSEQSVNPTDSPLGRPLITDQLTRGCQRLLIDEGCAVLREMKLANGRRADVVGLTTDGKITIVEVKSCRADFEVDQKWHEYLDYCDRFFFATTADFPSELLPDSEGHIIADGFGGAIIRDCEPRKLSAARRKAVILRFARQAAFAAMRAPVPSDTQQSAEGATQPYLQD